MHAFASWLMDLASPELIKFMSKSWGASVAGGNAPFLFGPADSTGFFASLGWREAQFRSTWDESIRLHRKMRRAWIYQTMGLFASKKRREAMRRFSGIALLERA